MSAPTAEHLALAHLALHFLPKIELPEGWETEDTGVLKMRLSMSSTGFGFRKSASWYGDPAKDTALEILTEEAVKRARVLLDTVQGIKRPQRGVVNHAKEEWQREERARFDKLRAAFKKLAGDRHTITEAEFLQMTFQGSRTRKAHRVKYLRAFLLDQKQHNPYHLFGSCNGELTEGLNMDTAVAGVDSLLAFVARHKGRLTKQWQREGQAKGGRVATAKAIKDKGIIGMSATAQKRLARRAGKKAGKRAGK